VILRILVVEGRGGGLGYIVVVPVVIVGWGFGSKGRRIGALTGDICVIIYLIVKRLLSFLSSRSSSLAATPIFVCHSHDEGNGIGGRSDSGK
jgi:hypothetical protein